MKAITIERYGGPEVLQRRDVEIPEPGPTDVLVRVAFAGINFMDIHTRQGKYARSQTYPVRLPCTLGMEGAGEVVKVGRDVTRVAPGDRVAWCISWGSYAEYACVPERLIATLPDAIAYDLAAATIFRRAPSFFAALSNSVWFHRAMALRMWVWSLSGRWPSPSLSTYANTSLFIDFRCFALSSAMSAPPPDCRAK